MKVLRSIALGLAMLAVIAAAPAASVRVPQAQIDAENARWSALGVKLPPGGMVLAHPYAAPYSNRSFVVPYAWYQSFYTQMRAHHDVPVDPAALREDLPVLRLLVEKAYAGYQPAAARGWNWNAMFRQWDAQLARSGNKKLVLTTAFAPWLKLQDVQIDNHSGVAGSLAFTSGSVSSVLAADPHGSCTALHFGGASSSKLAAQDAGQQPHAVQAWNGAQLSPAWYVSYPKRLGTATSVTCSGRAVALTPVPQVQPPSQRPVYQSIGDGIAYLRLPTFTDANNEALRTALSKAQNLGKERLVIFDLRDNDGGNAPSDILTNWFAESAIEQAGSMTQTGTTSCFATALSFSLQQQLIGGLKPPVSAGLQQALQQIADSLKGDATPNCSVQPQQTAGEHQLRDHQLTLVPPGQGQTRVIALVDAGCGSDCEYMTYVLGGLPGTVIAGASTYGVMGFTQPGYFVLPHSRVPFRLALSRTDAYGDGRSVDGYGITVDVLLPTAQSQSQSSITALAKMLAGTLQ
ncbi:MAG TPA: S41 family peptidase [Candidatus Baltobacteraceae bacterium]|nr:S41 family peptidase [Candidatus Baltobacteraceae bacterium]